MDKLSEKRILRMVYKESEYAIINESDEKPDFILKNNFNNVFGVEITEHFYSESAARLSKHEGYISRLLDDKISEKNKYLHWKDKKKLIIDTITVNDENGKVKLNTKAVIQHNPTRKEYLESIEKVIFEKDKKFINYNSSLSHIDLVILDHAAGLELATLDVFFESFYTTSIIKCLHNSPFNEISIVIYLKDGLHFFNLKELLLLSRLVSFLRVFKLNETNRVDKKYILNFTNSLLFCLEKEGFKNIGINFRVDNLELIYAGAKFELFHKRKFGLKINQNHTLVKPLYSGISDFMEIFKAYQNDSFYQQYENIITKNTFRCNYGYKC